MTGKIKVGCRVKKNNLFNRVWILLLFICALIISMPMFAEEAEQAEGVKLAIDFKAAGDKAKQKGIPLMIFFAAEYCEYCERLEADYLSAMANSNSYKEQVLIRKVVIDSYDDFIGFNGKVVEASDFSDDYDIQVTPTLVLVDHNGIRVGKRIIGYNASGFFGAELDSAIVFATQKIR